MVKFTLLKFYKIFCKQLDVCERRQYAVWQKERLNNDSDKKYQSYRKKCVSNSMFLEEVYLSIKEENMRGCIVEIIED